jgi:2-methylaconitate cis-trans-isomerase PrpF
MRLTRSLVGLFLGFVLLAAVGCGASTSDVSGNVTLDGTPLPAGTIVFIPAKGTAVSAEIKNGKYNALKVPEGEAKVTVDNNAVKVLVDQARKFSPPPGGTSAKVIPKGVTMSPEAKAALEKQQQQSADAAKQSKELIAKYRPIPDKFKDPEKSGLKFTVGKSSGTYDVPLTSK